MQPGFGLANLDGRAHVLSGERLIDVERRSAGALPADPMAVLEDWERFCDWAGEQVPEASDPALSAVVLGACVPRPRQVFGIGLNYRDHAAEAKLEIPEAPMVFTKFPSCLAGPEADIPLTSNRVDWEVELVVVIGRGGQHIGAGAALDHVAGYCVGQDISDRRLQFRDRPPQFSLGKSAPAFGPIGPSVVPLRCLPDPNDLRLTCRVSGETMQDSRSSEMIFGVRALIENLSSLCSLLPGDLIFTGTPAGVGSVREPRRYLAAGDVIETEIEGLGQMRNRCV